MIKHKFVFCVVGVLLCTSIYVDAAAPRLPLEKLRSQLEKLKLQISGLFNQIKPIAEVTFKGDMLSKEEKNKREREYDGKRCGAVLHEISEVGDNQNCVREHDAYTVEESCRFERCRLKRSSSGDVPFLVQPFITKNGIGCLKRNWEDLQQHLCHGFKDIAKELNIEVGKKLLLSVCKSVSEDSKSYEELIKLIKPRGLLYKDMKKATKKYFGKRKWKVHWDRFKQVFHKQTFCGPKSIRLPLKTWDKDEKTCQKAELCQLLLPYKFVFDRFLQIFQKRNGTEYQWRNTSCTPVSPSLESLRGEYLPLHTLDTQSSYKYFFIIDFSREFKGKDKTKFPVEAVKSSVHWNGSPNWVVKGTMSAQYLDGNRNLYEEEDITLFTGQVDTNSSGSYVHQVEDASLPGFNNSRTVYKNPIPFISDSYVRTWIVPKPCYGNHTDCKCTTNIEDCDKFKECCRMEFYSRVKKTSLDYDLSCFGNKCVIRVHSDQANEKCVHYGTNSSVGRMRRRRRLLQRAFVYGDVNEGRVDRRRRLLQANAGGS